MEEYLSLERDLHMNFCDLEKTYDRVPREVLWKAMEKKGVCVTYVRAIQDMYEGATTSVRTPRGETNDFPIKIGFSSLYLFKLVSDMLTKDIQKSIPKSMMFADDIILN